MDLVKAKAEESLPGHFFLVDSDLDCTNLYHNYVTVSPCQCLGLMVGNQSTFWWPLRHGSPSWLVVIPVKFRDFSRMTMSCVVAKTYNTPQRNCCVVTSLVLLILCCWVRMLQREPALSLPRYAIPNMMTPMTFMGSGHCRNHRKDVKAFDSFGAAILKSCFFVMRLGDFEHSERAKSRKRHGRRTYLYWSSRHMRTQSCQFGIACRIWNF